MALTPPRDAIYPKTQIKSVSVLYDGTLPGNTEFSIAELELHSGGKVIGIRHDRDVWNENDDEKGYPLVRGQYPALFILPDIDTLLPELIKLFGKD